MYKGVLFILMLSLGLGTASFAASDVVVADNFGKEKPVKNALAAESRYSKDLSSFSLRSGMQFRGEKIIDNSESTANYFNINTISTSSKGQTNFILSYKKRTFLNKVTVTFNPTEAVNNYNIR